MAIRRERNREATLGSSSSHDQTRDEFAEGAQVALEQWRSRQPTPVLRPSMSIDSVSYMKRKLYLTLPSNSRESKNYYSRIQVGGRSIKALKVINRESQHVFNHSKTKISSRDDIDALANKLILRMARLYSGFTLDYFDASHHE